MEAGKDPRVDQDKDREGGGFSDPPDNSKTKPAPGSPVGDDTGDSGSNRPGDSGGSNRPGDSGGSNRPGDSGGSNRPGDDRTDDRK